MIGRMVSGFIGSQSRRLCCLRACCAQASFGMTGLVKNAESFENRYEGCGKVHPMNQRLWTADELSAVCESWMSTCISHESRKDVGNRNGGKYQVNRSKNHICSRRNTDNCHSRYFLTSFIACPQRFSLDFPNVILR